MTDPSPFGFERLEYVREAKRSKELNGLRVPFVVISASGMCGYQAEHTLGRRIVERRDEVKIFGRPHKLRARVEVMNTFSAHADEPGLVHFVGSLDRDRLKTVFLVHGDPDRQALLTDAFAEAGLTAEVEAPARGDAVTL